MNRTKKLTGIFCVLLLAAVFLTSGVAAASRVIPDGVTPCSITIHKYMVNDMPMTGDGLNNGLLISESQLPKGAVALKGVHFKITKVKIKDNAQHLDVDNVETDTSEAYSVDVETTSSGTVLVPNLKQGIYLIEEVENPIVTAYAAPFLVQLPFTDPMNADNLLYDVHVYPKNTLEAEPDIEKSVTYYGNRADSVGVAGTEKQTADDGTVEAMNQRLAHFIESPKLPSDIGICNEFYVTDQIDNRLEYVAGQTVKVTGVPINEETPKVSLSPDVDFTVTEPGETNGYTLTVYFTQEGRQKLAQVIPGNKVAQKARADIEFDCALKLEAGTAYENQGVKIPNTCTLHYTNSLGYNHSYESNEVEVHTGGVSILKVDKSDGTTPLQGAEFMIFTSEEDARNGVNAVKVPGTNEDYVVRTNAQGIASFYGLPYGDTGEAYNDETLTKDYWIVETKAPLMTNGQAYELYKQPIKVTISSVSHKVEDAITVFDDKPTSITPTGLMDSDVLSLLGAGVVVAAGIVVLAAKRRQSL